MLFNKKKLSIHKIAFLFANIRFNNKGFTVLEMIIVASIMVILLSVSIANFRGFETSQVLSTEAEKISSILRQAQIWALVGQTSNSVRYNYGVHFEECAAGDCQYFFFKDLNSDNLYESGEEIISFNLIKGAYVEILEPLVGNDLDIVFTPPDARIYFNNSIAQNEAGIILKSSLVAGLKTITVNRISGQVNID